MQAHTWVIKYGGNAMADDKDPEAFARVIAAFSRPERQLIIVHGGGPQIDKWLTKTGTTSHFSDGQRYTDKETLDVAEMALCAHVNKAIVRALQRWGIPAVGISGQDGSLLVADRVEKLGYVGKICTVNPTLIRCLTAGGYIPVVAPIACSLQHEPLNVNADYAAAHIAGALEAEQLILMTNVAGILDTQQRRVPLADRRKIRALVETGIISGGMLPKADCALRALNSGCQSVVILDGRTPENLNTFAAYPERIGTRIVR